MTARDSLKILLISPYDLGRQPFALAHPARWLRDEGFEVACLDLSQDRLTPELLSDVGLVAIHLGMHTATRIALELLARLETLAPTAHLCAYGLYAPMNEEMLRGAGFGAVIGGEYEGALVSLAKRVLAGKDLPQIEPVINMDRLTYRLPDRRGLRTLDRYACLHLPTGGSKRVGFVNASRGCKHRCRHCPIVPVYDGLFRVAPANVVLEDIDQQIAQGAEHISFGDPDFLNGPRHALKIVEAMHAAHPDTTWDAVIKIEHLLKHADLLPRLAETGCLFITSAVESLDDGILEKFAKGHTARDFEAAAALMKRADIALSPTFVPFTPWTSLEGYLEMLEGIIRSGLIEAVSPVQLSIRLLIPAGSRLLELDGIDSVVQGFDPNLLGHPWKNVDPRVDELQHHVQALVAERQEEDRHDVFRAIWRYTHEMLDRPAPPLERFGNSAVPTMSEAWYCCAEPTNEQLTVC